MTAMLWVFGYTGSATTEAIGWKPDWMAGPKEAPWWFWLENFGLFLPGCIGLLICLLIPAGPLMRDAKQKLQLLFFPAAAIFVACSFIKFVPWECDTPKLFFWAYLVCIFC